MEASGTVVSEESKTYFSPVNAKVDKVDFKEGDTVKAGTELVAFDKKDLEREQKKADLNVESGKLEHDQYDQQIGQGSSETERCRR